MTRTVGILWLLAATAAAEDWREWRGPERTGVISWKGPDGWPETLAVRWRVVVGEGHSSPSVAGDRVYQFSRQNDREVVRALRLADGTTLWEQSYDVAYRMNPAATGHGKGPKSTPLVSGGRVFTLGIHGMLLCHDAATGELVWQMDSRSSPLYGHAMSPLLEDGKLIVHLGEAGRGALAALDPSSGRSLWRVEGDGPGYASPIVVDLGGTRQLVTQTDAHIVGVALDSGELSWKLPFTTPYDQNIVTPILYRDTLVFSGLQTRTFAVSLSGNEPREIWSNALTFYMSTPVLIGDRLVGFSDRNSGHFAILDAASGETSWTGPPRQGDNAALVVAGDWILALTDGGTLGVVSATADALDFARTYSVADSPTWAHPIPVPDGILIKDERALTFWSVP